MASLSSLPTFAGTQKTILPSLTRTKSQPSKPRKQSFYNVQCRASNGDSPSNLDRRNVLLGLGGLYGAATLNADTSAMAAPVTTPNIRPCNKSTILKPGTSEIVDMIDCCPPLSANETVEFILPPPSLFNKYRVRRPAHKLTKPEVKKFEEAVRRMKDLDDSDPRSFSQQAKIHCAYCNDGYEQEGFPGIDLQVHENWFFFPFHRWYVYFFERILGHLINDPTFALPFWNWDTPEGMMMPAIYDNENSPLYDELRNPLHRPPKLLDLNYSGSDDVGYDIINSNLSTMNRQMFTNAKTAEFFFGSPLRGGEAAIKGVGSIENIPHNKIHFWGGGTDKTKSPYGEDIGNFYSSGRDALFYGLHGNVDRMWSLWKELGKGKNKDFEDRDWLDSSFVFYDEKKRAVRVKVGDCLDTRKLGYVYENVPILWKDFKRKPIKEKQFKTLTKKLVEEDESTLKRVRFPVVLDSKVSTTVKRPKKSRGKNEKKEEDEILVIEGIKFDRSYPIHFDVLINGGDDEEKISPENTEFAGSFTNVPHFHKHGADESKTELRLSITELIEELECDDDDTVFVTLVPRIGGDKVTIGGISIKYLSII